MSHGRAHRHLHIHCQPEWLNPASPVFFFFFFLGFFQSDTNPLHLAFSSTVIAPPLLRHSLPLELQFFFNLFLFLFFLLPAVWDEAAVPGKPPDSFKLSSESCLAPLSNALHSILSCLLSSLFLFFYFYSIFSFFLFLLTVFDSWSPFFGGLCMRTVWLFIPFVNFFFSRLPKVMYSKLQWLSLHCFVFKLYTTTKSLADCNWWQIVMDCCSRAPVHGSQWALEHQSIRGSWTSSTAADKFL
jgi:hypothetical protein